jgi:3-oxoacyl-[acyl-carrier protein] reductase
LTPVEPTATYADLAGKVAVVTGGSKGIGAATSRLLAANGVRACVNARSKEGVEAVVEEIRTAGGEAMGVAADCTRWDEIERLRTSVEAKLGPVDVLFAFAGGFTHYKPAHETTEEEWREVIDSNLTSTFLCVRSFLPGMIERRRGVVITMSSNTARFVDILTTAAYAAAKGGVIAFTRHLAREVGQYGIRANCVAPATVLSERVEKIMTPERQAEVAAIAPLGRMGTPEDVAHASVFLASEAAGWITGVTLDVAGGRIML